MTRVVLCLVALAVACRSSSSDDAEIDVAMGRTVCEGLALQLERVQLDAESELLNLPRSDLSRRQAGLREKIGNLRDTRNELYALTVGLCLKDPEPPECSFPPVPADTVSADATLHEAIVAYKTIRQGLRGKGPCAAPQSLVSKRQLCTRFARRLSLDGQIGPALIESLDRAQAGVAESNSSAESLLHSWRNSLFLAGAAVSDCVDSAIRTSCDELVLRGQSGTWRDVVGASKGLALAFVGKGQCVSEGLAVP